MDTRGEGGYVLCPPSKTTRPYTWDEKSIPEIHNLPRVEDIKGLSEILIKESVESRDLPKKVPSAGSLMRGKQILFLPAREGQRNATATRVAGSAANVVGSVEQLYDILQFWNHVYCVPSMDMAELRSVADSIWKKHNGIR